MLYELCKLCDCSFGSNISLGQRSQKNILSYELTYPTKIKRKRHKSKYQRNNY
jgi:hypothetical protein